uniref:F-box containing protein n=1 Tax=Marseillevirus sp. TaxID=2809551 RepID=A0AA96EKX3_9VIRU|nr:F-box containing protein [Marseillevirus sp.]
MEFQDFPLEVVSHIVSFLPSVKHINAFGQTCSAYHKLIRGQDMRFVRKEYGTIPLSIESGCFHISPTGVLHGFCLSFSLGNATASTYSHGVLSGFYMEVSENGFVESGTYKNGEPVGLWKNDSECFQKKRKGFSHRTKYDEDGGHVAHTQERGSETIYCYGKGRKILAIYNKKKLSEGFYCGKADRTFYTGFSLHLMTVKGFQKAKTRFYHCCKEHQGDMPDDLLRFETLLPSS